MNWTGGTLQRTKHANKGVLQKQKAYFAKSRTHLQNGHPSKAAPFRPSYALQDDTNLIQHLRTESLTLLDRDSIGRAHLIHDSAHPRDSATRDLQRVRTALTDDDAAPPRSRERDVIERHKMKREKDDSNTELELLEARRRQLLEKRDWIGVTPSQPLLPSFFASKDRSRIGKRRWVRGSHGAPLRHRNRNHADVAARPPGLVGNQYSGAASRTKIAGHLDDLRIRIGTDALTTVASTIPNEPDQSFTSSEFMLFDQQNQDAETIDTTQLARPITSPPDIAEQPRAMEGVYTRSESQSADEQLPRYGTARTEVHGKHLRPHRSSKHTVHARGGVMLNDGEEAAHEHLDPQLQITHCIEGVRQPFRLVFNSSNSFGNGRSHDDSIRETRNGGKNCASHAANADETERKNMHELSGKAGIQFESEAAAASPIVDVDEALWKSVLDLAEQSSSHTGASKTTGTSAVHAHPKARSHELERCSWSQHATQGDQTRIGSSLISASLPSLKQEVQLRTNMQGARNVKRRDTRADTMLDQEERLWQNFVFGSGEGMSSSDGHDRGAGSIQHWKPSSGVPLSVAVSPVSNTPIRARRAPRTLDSVHDTAIFALPSEYRTIAPSAATAGRVDKVCDGEGERSASSRRSVTHSSLLNNASGEKNLSYSGKSGRIETSRGGLEQTDRSRDSLLSHDAGSGPQRFLHVSPDPDDWELDLVDPDRV